MAWFAGAVFVSPPINQVLVTTGQLACGTYTVRLLATCNPPGLEVMFQLVAADGITVQKSKILPLTLAVMPLILEGFGLLNNQESFRLVLRQDGTGYEVEASIFTKVV